MNSYLNYLSLASLYNSSHYSFTWAVAPKYPWYDFMFILSYLELVSVTRGDVGCVEVILIYIMSPSASGAWTKNEENFWQLQKRKKNIPF